MFKWLETGLWSIPTSEDEWCSRGRNPSVCVLAAGAKPPRLGPVDAHTEFPSPAGREAQTRVLADSLSGSRALLLAVLAPQEGQGAPGGSPL